MGIKLRLILLNFLQFFIWGAWLLTIGALATAALREEERRAQQFEERMEGALTSVVERAVEETTDFGED